MLEMRVDGMVDPNHDGRSSFPPMGSNDEWTGQRIVTSQRCFTRRVTVKLDLTCETPDCVATIV